MAESYQFVSPESGSRERFLTCQPSSRVAASIGDREPRQSRASIISCTSAPPEADAKEKHRRRIAPKERALLAPRPTVESVRSGRFWSLNRTLRTLPLRYRTCLSLNGVSHA
jgi:hypothetical protein